MSSDNNSLKKQFESAADLVKKVMHNGTGTIDEKGQIYGYYKQSLVGNCNIKQPSRINVTDYEKWKNWKKLEGISKQDAMNAYIDIVIALSDKYTTD
jgi:acyl-CoA-binding protein